MEMRLVGQKGSSEGRVTGRMYCRVSCTMYLSNIISWWRGVKPGEGQGTHTQRRLLASTRDVKEANSVILSESGRPRDG